MEGNIANALTAVNSANNQIEECYTATKGGAWSLIHVDFDDTGSTYKRTAAIHGGAFFAADSEVSVVNADFSTHLGYRGGLAYLNYPRATSFT